MPSATGVLLRPHASEPRSVSDDQKPANQIEGHIVLRGRKRGAEQQGYVTLHTPRDREILAALAHSPLTAAQLLKWSQTFERPFSDERRVRERLCELLAAGRVRRDRYIGIAGRGVGAPAYYFLSPLGYQLLHGVKPGLTARRAFSPIGIARQHHGYSLAEFLVHTIVAARRDGFTLTEFSRENARRLEVGEESLYPDAAFTLVTPDSREYVFFVEIDNSTESVRSDKDVDSWERKIKFYDRYRDRDSKGFRVLVVATRSAMRLRHILQAASDLQRNPWRSLFYGISLEEYLRFPDALTIPCFTDHRGQAVALVRTRNN